MENFTEFVRKDLLDVRPQQSEGLAWLAAIARTSSTLLLERKGFVMRFESENEEIIRTVLHVWRALYPTPIETTVERVQSGLRKGQSVCVAKLTQGGTKRLLADIGLMREDDGSLTYDVGIPEFVTKSENNRKTYVKALFIGAGTATLPSTGADGERTNGYHMEIHLMQESLAVDLVELLRVEGIEAKRLERKETQIVYIKDREMLSNFFAYIGSGDAVMRVQAVIIEREVSNRLNRESNFLTSNLDKTAKASAEQVHALEIIDKHIGLDQLPAPLREVADVRLEHPYATFAEMQEQLPDIGKSGLNHRWRKIMQLARELQEKHGE